MKNQQLYLLLLFPVVFFIFIRFGYKFNGLYGQDAHAYLAYSKQLSFWILNGNNPPPFFWPVTYPLLGGLLGAFTFYHDFWLQLISALSFSGVLWFTYQLYDAKKKKWQIVSYIFVLLALSPIMLRHSVVIMSDLTALFFIMGTWYFAKNYKTYGLIKWLLVSIIFAALAFTTRYVSVLLLFVPFYWITKTIIQQKKLLPPLIALLVFTVFLLPNFWLRKNTSTLFLNHSWLSNWNLLNLFKLNFTTNEGTFSYTVPNILYVLSGFVHIYFVFFGLILLRYVNYTKTFKKHQFYWLTLGIYLLFLAGIPYQNHRFLILAMPFIAMILIPPFTKFYKWIKKRAKLQIVFVVVVIFTQLGLFTFNFAKIYRRNLLEQQVALKMLQYPDKVLYAFDVDVSLPSYGVKNEIRNLWRTPYSDFEKGALVIFNEEAFSKQWKGKNPMINWENLNQKYLLKKVTQFNEGYILYEIE